MASGAGDLLGEQRLRGELRQVARVPIGHPECGLWTCGVIRLCHQQRGNRFIPRLICRERIHQKRVVAPGGIGADTR